MKSHTAYFWIGTWLLIVPYLGVPGNWKDRLVILTALCFLVYGLILMRQHRYREDEDRTLLDEAIEEESDSTINQA